MEIEKGWRFVSADFSIEDFPGYVMLERVADERKLWHKMPEELKEAYDGPPLYVRGHGMTFEEAVVNANLIAAHAKPIPAS